MRRTETSLMFRALHLAVVPLVIGLTAGAARAADDDRTFSEKISDGFYGMIRGTNMDNRGIDYRERSPLVVPPTLDLPPPAAASSGEAQIANWPKDPDERQRKAVIAAKKKSAPPPQRVQVTTAGAAATMQAARPVNIAPPTEEPQAAATPARPAYANDRNGTARIDPVYDQPGDLFTGGAAGLADSIGLGGLFGNGKTEVVVQPGTEPVREALTQPPIGYQSPSPNYAYGVTPKGLLDGQSNPDRNPQAQMSSASSVAK
jgi:hypothetical protein